MNLRRDLLIPILTVLAFADADAKIAMWSIHPKYDNLQRYYRNLYVYQQNGKWGMVQSGDKVLLDASCDFITPFWHGYALAGIKEGNRYLLKHIISESGNVTAITTQYYLPSPLGSQFVSEGKLAVINSSGKYGFISANGSIVVRCQFDYAMRFSEGWASVRQDNYTMYISEAYDRDRSYGTLPVDFHYGEMTMSSCFYGGTAIVAYNKDFAAINSNGQKIKKLNEAEFKQLYKRNNASKEVSESWFSEASRYSVFAQDGKFGLKEGETVIVPTQFDSFATQYNDGVILTQCNGRQGVLAITDGEIGLKSYTAEQNPNEIEVDQKGQPSSIAIDCSIPSSLNAPRVLVDKGDGIYEAMLSQGNSREATKSYSITPVVGKGSESCVIKIAVENDGITLARLKKTFMVRQPIRLRVSAPGPSTIRADENDIATFSATIYNDSSRPATVTATWSTGQEVSVTIPAHGSKTITGTTTVTASHTKDISLSLDTGERVQSSILFQPYF